MGFILNECTMMMIFCPSIFPMGVSGFIFHCAIQDGILRIGVLYWLDKVFDNSVEGLVIGLVRIAKFNS